MTTYTIRFEPHYYRGTFGVHEPGPLTDDYGDVIALATRAQAQAVVSMLNAGQSNVLSHGQYAQTEYSVRRSKRQPWSISAVMRALALDSDFNVDGTRRNPGH